MPRICPSSCLPTRSSTRFTDFVYAEDLPVFVSADSILDALHRSYDAILEDLEPAALIPQLTRLLGSMRARLADDHSLSAEVAQDVDFHLTVAASLLMGQVQQPSTGIDPSEVEQFFSSANAATGTEDRMMFGVIRSTGRAACIRCGSGPAQPLCLRARRRARRQRPARGGQHRALGPPPAEHPAGLVVRAPPRHAPLREAILHGTERR